MIYEHIVIHHSSLIITVFLCLHFAYRYEANKGSYSFINYGFLFPTALVSHTTLIFLGEGFESI